MTISITGFGAKKLCSTKPGFIKVVCQPPEGLQKEEKKMRGSKTSHLAIYDRKFTVKSLVSSLECNN